MKKVLILSGVSTNGKATSYAKYFSKDIDEYEFYDIKFDQLVIEITPTKFEILDGLTNIGLNEYDLVMVREYAGLFLDIAYVVSKYLQYKKTPFFNKNYLNYRPVSKIAQAVNFFEQGVNFPATYFSLNSDFVLHRAQHLGFPLIAKDTLGMHGANNYKIKSAEELREIFAKSPGVKFVVQEFIPNSFDYRVLIMGDQQPLEIKRTAAAGSHLNNTSQGGIGELVSELPTAVLESAKKLTRAFSIEIGGVDVVKSQATGDYYFLEVNNQPQLVTGAETDAKMDKFKLFLDSYFNKTD